MTKEMIKNKELIEFYQRANDTALDYPRDQSLHQCIAERCREFSDKVAVFCEDEELTYEQLDSASNRVANYLVAQGVGPGDLIGVCCNRNIDMPILLNGILRSGAGYVPLDPDYPLDRLKYMVENADIQHVLAHESLQSITEAFDVTTIYYDSQNPEIQSQADSQPKVETDVENDVAYVIFTSGSTGKPKGVLVHHRAAVNLMFAFGYQPGFNSDDRLLATTTLSFDISVVEMFLPLVHGGQIVIVDRATAKDQHRLVEVAEKFQVTWMQATPSHWRIICDSDFVGGKHIKFLTGGEKLPRDLIEPLLQRCGELWNCYGPTETTVYSSANRMTNAVDRILVGKPLANTTAYVVDENGQLCVPEVEGELWIGGDCVTLGYMKRDELTAEKYVMFNGERVYRSGDLAKITESGDVEIIGRIDSQVKVRGHRIELGEIDAAMKAASENVRLAAAVVREDQPGDVRLVGYVLPKDGDTVDLLQLKTEMAKSLPDYMIPSVFSVVEEFYYTPSGKTDRKAFPLPSTLRPDIGVDYVAPKSKNEKQLADIWRDVLQLDQVGVADNFFELGGNSIKALKVVKYSNQILGTRVTNAEFFDSPTIRTFIETGASVSAAVKTRKKSKPNRKPGEAAFAVVGLAVKLPGAKNVDEFWQNLCDGKETTRFFEQQEIDSTLPSELVENPAYVKARGIIDQADYIDARFFNMPPREAELVDPQQRVMLELAWTALEDAGCIPGKFDGKIGVWAGTYATTYFTKNLLTHPEIVEQTGEFQLGTYNEKDYIATRVAHRLNLNGPAINVNTACSTSLVAIIQACSSLQSGFCDAAIAGGVSIHFPQRSGHLHQEGSIFSPDGHCRPFDADSAGTLFSDGAGAVVLKRLDDAIADNDQIYAVVKGFGINNDGGNKASFSAPSIEGQADAIAMAHANSEIEADSISYVEAHGTATPIGDPIEVAALTRAFGATTDKKQYCGIGSVKSNFGHTVAAAGVIGFVKTVLALKNETIPATLHYKRPNPQIDFESTPFYVCDKQTPWPRKEQPRRAGVSSFGVGGTNAHIILQEAPAVDSNAEGVDYQLLLISAKNETAFEKSKQNLIGCLADETVNLADAAETLNGGRQNFAYRGFCVADSIELAVSKMNSGKSPGFISRKSNSNRNAVFMFPGQGAQYVRMGQDLYQRIPSFTSSIDTCFDILEPLLGQDLRKILFPAKGDEEAAQATLKETSITQPALFAVGYSMAQAMISLGVRPTALIGHSIGEFAAACIADVFSLEDGLKFIAKRGELMQNLPGGCMMSVRLPGDKVEPLIQGQMAIASYNGPELCVVAGPDDEVQDLQKQLEADGVLCKHLHTSHAFHSPMMDSVVDPFAKIFGGAELRSPEIPIFSTVAGDWMRDEEAIDPNYWAEHLRQPVRFSDAISKLWNEDPSLVLIELGPRKTLSTLALQHAADRKSQIAVPTMSDTVEDQAEWKSFLTAAGQLWSLGIKMDLAKLPTGGRKISLPTYPFERKRFFVEPGNSPGSQQETQSIPNTEISRTTTDLPAVVAGQPDSGNLTMNRLPKIIDSIKEVFENSSGFDLNEFEDETTFFEMGLDSLVLTQTATALKRNFDVEVTFRQLLEDTPNVYSLAVFLDSKLPADRFAVEPVAEIAKPEITNQNVAQMPAQQTASIPTSTGVVNQPTTQNSPQPQVQAFAPVQLPMVVGDGAQSIINNQLQLMAAQLQLLGGGNVQVAPNVVAEDETPGACNAVQEDKPTVTVASSDNKPTTKNEAPAKNETPAKKAFGAAARVNLNSDELDDSQQAKLNEIIRDTENMMPGSKAYAQKHRQYMADPRTVSGFRPNMKEMTFPIVVEKSKGVYLYDLDGNEFVDYTCGFGSNFLGHSTDMIVDAVKQQLPSDYSIGPQSPLAGDVARMFCELTGSERMAFSNTGSEAVLGCTRLARTYTGKQKIAMFTGDYHGILDEVIVRGNKNFKSFPAATGIPREHVDNTMILEYGTEESLQIIRDNLDDLAAVVVETVQSRRPEFQPRDFLHDLRAITEDVDTALIFDEVITGFRIAPGGAQQHFGISADLASYGKVVGGGMPIGLIGGRAKYMDGLDGGFWQYGDDSRPEAGMTYFAGTFVRHPLTLAASKAILEFIKREGQPMYDRLNSLSNNMADQLNGVFKELDAPLYLANFGSMFKVQFEQELPYSELIFAKLRLKGFFIWDHRPCLLNVQHTQEHVDAFVQAFREVIIELQRTHFVPGDGYKKCVAFDAAKPPCAEAKIGKDRQGNPGWFIQDDANPGQFVQVSQSV